jgi:hypothetical protein
MKSSHISFYFVLYIVAIITVFVITMERDRLLRERDEDIAHLIEVYVKPLRLSAYVDTVRAFISPNQPQTGEPVRLRVKADGPMDRSDIKFTLIGVESEGPGTVDPSSVTVANDNGDGVVTTPPLEAGIYRFAVSGYKHRVITAGKTMKVQIRDTTYVVQYSERLKSVDTDTAYLIAKVEKSGIAPPQITLSVQETNDTWVLGPAFVKKIFVGGVQDISGVSFSVTPPARIERSAEDRSFVQCVWDKPELGKRSFTVSVDAHRGLGAKDVATVAFGVQVFPASFGTLPSDKGFWGIPYVFDGQIAGLGPLDLSVEATRDGQPLGTKPVVPKDTVVPQQGWKSLSFTVLYRGSPIKTHRVTLQSPPPPQIRWVQQNLDRSRSVFLISAESSDPIGGPVRLSLQSEPSGIATLDKIRGTRFTITIDLKGRPSAVFLKLIATDQFGGQGISSKQFNIPQ